MRKVETFMVLRISSALWFKGDLFLTNIGKLSPVMNSNIHTVKMLKYQILIPILYTQFYLFIYLYTLNFKLLPSIYLASTFHSH